jgi:anti-anti-sigma factor
MTSPAIPQQRPENSCRVTLLRSDHESLLIVSGEIDIETVPTLRHALREATMRSVHVHVDLDNVTFIGAAGLNALLVANRGCQSAGCRLQVHTTDEFVHKLLALTGLRFLTLSA